jgi:arylsulfatase A
VLSLADMLASFAALVGQDLHADAGPDSYNMLPALLGQKLEKPIRPALVVQSTGSKWTAIRSGPWKLIPWLGSGGFLTKPREIEPKPGGPAGRWASCITWATIPASSGTCGCRSLRWSRG